MNGSGCPAPSANALDDQGGAGGRIPTGKDVGNVRLKDFRIRIDGVPAGDLKIIDPFALAGEAYVGTLANGGDDHVGFEKGFGSFDGYRTAPSAGVRLTKLHLLILKMRHVAVFIAVHLDGGGQEVKLDASCSAATISTSLAGISLRVRR